VPTSPARCPWPRARSVAPLPPPPELARVARPGAGLVVVTPTPDHLAGLRLRLGLLDVPAGKPSRLAARHAAAWQVVGREDVAAEVSMDRGGMTDVVAMGPNAWHIDDRLREALLDLPDRLTTTISVTVTTFART
jgi:23S rRNA (guanine745-N1)-methyltransferase